MAMMFELRLLSKFSLPCLMRSAVNSAMCTILVCLAFLNTVPVMGFTGVCICGPCMAPFMVSMYWFTTRHMWPHSPPRIHLAPRRLASAYILPLMAFIMSALVNRPKLPPSEAYVLMVKSSPMASNRIR